MLTSVLVQGTTLGMVAKKLGVDEPEINRPVSPLEFTPSTGIKSELVELSVAGNSAVAGKQLVNIDFPEATLVVLLGRNDEFIVPTGSTTLESGDHLLILVDPDHLAQVRAVIESPEQLF